MRKTKVLVVDDSSFSRRAISECLSRDPEVEVVGTASGGQHAIALVDALEPDVMTLDIEMPDLDGLSTLRALQKKHPHLPVIMCSSLTERGASATLQSLAEGACCYVTKPRVGSSFADNLNRLSADLLPKVKALGARSFIKRRVADRMHSPVPPRPENSLPKQSVTPVTPTFSMEKALESSSHPQRIDAIVIAASTGGPAALATLLPSLPKDLSVPVAVVQHMPAVFTRLLAERLNAECAIPVQEAQTKSPFLPGTILIAPGGFHLSLELNHPHPTTILTQDEPDQFCRPSANRLFQSAARIFGQNTLGIVLTGMGCDATDGCREIRKYGGRVIAQDEASSIIWGMPRSVAENGLANSILPLRKIAQEIIFRTSIFRRK